MVYILKYMYKGYKGYKGLYNMMGFTYLFPRPLFQRSVGVDQRPDIILGEIARGVPNTRHSMFYEFQRQHAQTVVRVHRLLEGAKVPSMAWCIYRAYVGCLEGVM